MFNKAFFFPTTSQLLFVLWKLLNAQMLLCFDVCDGRGTFKITPIRISYTKMDMQASDRNLVKDFRFSLQKRNGKVYHQGAPQRIKYDGTKSIFPPQAALQYEFIEIKRFVHLILSYWLTEYKYTSTYSTVDLIKDRNSGFIITFFKFYQFQYRFKFSYNMTCDKYSKGPLCGTCRSDVSHPFYFCEEGKKVCKNNRGDVKNDCELEEGYYDDENEERVDDTTPSPTKEANRSPPCNLNPCKNGARCINVNNDYVCRCSDYFKGKNCSVSIDACALLNPCQNGATCKNKIGGYECKCEPQFEGRHCDVDMNECKDSPCLNDGTCENLYGGYKCKCKGNFGGINCTEEMDICSIKKPCHHGGTCIDMKTTYRCLCPSGLTGKHCLEDIDECHPNPCVNGGTCINLFGDFTCRCPSPYIGKKCSLNKTVCTTDSPCKNGGTCVMLLNGVYCKCPPGFEGKHCSKDVDECKTHKPCLNNGICENTVGSFQCNCRANFFGKQCQYEEHNCLKQSCLNEGNCDTIDGKYFCKCKNVNRGHRCEQEHDACHYGIELCQNNGTCVNKGDGGMFCQCQGLYNGDYCQYGVYSYMVKQRMMKYWTSPWIAIAVGFGIVLGAILVSMRWSLDSCVSKRDTRRRFRREDV